MCFVYSDIPVTRIFPSQTMDHTRDPRETAPMKHPRNHMEIVMNLFKTRDTANPGRKLTKDITDRDTYQDRYMDGLLTCTNRQIELNIAYNIYYRIKASSNSSSQHT